LFGTIKRLCSKGNEILMNMPCPPTPLQMGEIREGASPLTPF